MRINIDTKRHNHSGDYCVYIGGEKKEKLTELALLYGKAKRRLFNTATTPCDGFAAVFAFDDVMPPSRSLFHLRFVFWVVSAR